MSLSLRKNAAREALFSTITMYMPTHQAVSDQARTAIEAACLNIENVAADESNDDLAFLRETLSNWEEAATRCGFEGVTEALGHLLSLAGANVGDAADKIGFVPPAEVMAEVERGLEVKPPLSAGDPTKEQVDEAIARATVATPPPASFVLPEAATPTESPPAEATPPDPAPAPAPVGKPKAKKDK